MKTRFNLVGDTFTYRHGGNLGYSVHGKAAKHLEWVQDNSAEDTFYIDRWMDESFRDRRGGKRYGWLLESRSVYPHLKDQIINNLSDYLSAFDLIFTHDKELLNICDTFKFVPAQWSWIENPSYKSPKYKLVSMISSSKEFFPGHTYRLQWVNKLRDKLDLYGRGFNEIERKEEGLVPYMFSVAIENGVYETYFTEKIIDCFLTGTIPIYHGAPDIGDHFNLDGIIILTDDFDVSQLSTELWWSKYDAIRDNFKRALEIGVLEDYIVENYFNGTDISCNSY